MTMFCCYVGSAEGNSPAPDVYWPSGDTASRLKHLRDFGQHRHHQFAGHLALHSSRLPSVLIRELRGRPG